MSSENDCIVSRTRTRSGKRDTDEQDDHPSTAPITIQKKKKTVDDATSEEVVAYAKKHWLNVIMKDAELNILVLQAKLRHEYMLRWEDFLWSKTKLGLEESLQFE